MRIDHSAQLFFATCFAAASVVTFMMISLPTSFISTAVTGQVTSTDNTCIDGDGGPDYKTKATTTYQKGSVAYQDVTDWCVTSTTLQEHYCNEKNERVPEVVTCEDGCSDGACKGSASIYYEPDPVSDGTDYGRDGCHDTHVENDEDGADDMLVQGETWNREGTKVTKSKKDTCARRYLDTAADYCDNNNSNYKCYARKYFCSNTKVVSVDKLCGSACNLGKCDGIEKEVVEEADTITEPVIIRSINHQRLGSDEEKNLRNAIRRKRRNNLAKDRYKNNIQTTRIRRSDYSANRPKRVSELTGGFNRFGKASQGSAVKVTPRQTRAQWSANKRREARLKAAQAAAVAN